LSIDLKRAFTFLWEDPERRRELAMGVGFGLVPVFNLVCLGYAVAVFRRVVEGVEDSEALPDWLGLGEHLFRGIAAFLVLAVYGTAFGIVYLIVSMPLAFALFGSSLTGHHVGARVLLLGLVGLVLFMAYAWLSLMALALYAENLEVSAAFGVMDVAQHLVRAGREQVGPSGLVVAWGCLVAAWAHFIPSLVLVWILAVLLGYPCLLATAHALGQVVRMNCAPQLRDPLDWAAGESGARSGRPDHHEVAGLRPRSAASSAPGAGRAVPARPSPGRKASSFIERPSETVLTWSTDSDEPDKD